jgi:hypothetical protein
MQIDLQPENFVLIFQKSDCLIRVLSEYDMFNFRFKGLKDPVPRKTYNKNPTGVVIALNATHNVILDIGSSFETTLSGNKRDWILNAINSRMIDRGCSYLYLHEGVTLGFYNFRNKNFTPFMNNDDAHVALNHFLHKMQSTPVSQFKQLQIEKDIDEYLNGCSDEDDDDREYFNDAENSDDDDHDSSSEEEIHIVLQTAPVQKKSAKSVKSL